MNPVFSVRRMDCVEIFSNWPNQWTKKYYSMKCSVPRKYEHFNSSNYCWIIIQNFVCVFDEIYFQYGCIVALCLLALNPSAINRSKFVFDDHVAIARNSDVTNTTRPIRETIHRILQHDFWGSNITSATSHKSYRPLVTLMFNLEYRMHHPDVVAVYMKWMNLWMHCAMCCLLLTTLPKLMHDIDEKIVWLTTAMFAIHPVHTEAICGIVGRADLMCALFYMLAINFHVELLKHDGRRWRKNLLYVTLFVLTAFAVMCKEIGITILVRVKRNKCNYYLVIFSNPQPFCIVYDILNELFSKRRHQTSESNNPSKQRIPSTVMIRCTILAVMSVVITLVRLFVMNFQSPKFKAPDNPIAAADDILAKVCIHRRKTTSNDQFNWMFFFCRLCLNNFYTQWTFGCLFAPNGCALIGLSVQLNWSKRGSMSEC